MGDHWNDTCSWQITPRRKNMMIVIMDVDLAVDPSASPKDVLNLEYFGKAIPFIFFAGHDS